MRILQSAWALLREAFGLYWVLVRIVVPVMVITRIAVELGAIKLLAPLFAPVMTVLGLPPELGFAWVTGLLVGIWGGAVAMFAVVPVETLTTAQVTIFWTLILFAHALPIEQRIVQKAGPGFLATSALRLLGGFVYGLLLHLLFEYTGWLSQPASPIMVPAASDSGWLGFVYETAEALAWMFIILFSLVVAMRLLEVVGLMRWLRTLLSPVLRLSGVGPAAAPLTIVGLLLGLSYGGGLIIREAREGHLGARDVFLAASLMSLAHSLIEDTLVAVALGADLTSVLLGRVIFSIAIVALMARLIRLVPEQTFFRYLFKAA